MNNLEITWIRQGARALDVRPLLLVKSLCVRVGVRQVLDSIDLEVYEGDHVRITGPNGCGKSTLLNAIAGIAPAKIEGGHVHFQDMDITSWSSHERARQGIAYMRQVDNIFPSLTIRENLIMALGRDGYEQFAQVFPEWVGDFPPNKRAGQLSGGQRKKVAWGMTVLRNAPLILADEPEAGVAHRFEPPETKTYIMVTHQ